MFRKPHKPIFWRMLREINKIKMEFAEETNSQSNLDYLSNQLEVNLQCLKKEVGYSSDFVSRETFIGLKKNIKLAICYIDGMVDKQQIEWSILRPLKNEPIDFELGINSLTKNFELIQSKLLTGSEPEKQNKTTVILDNILSGNTAVIIEGYSEALILSTPGWEKRSIEQPEIEVNVRGSREAFTETLRTNTTQLRRRIGHPDLRLDQLTIGQKTKTKVSVTYLKGVVDHTLVCEVKRRLYRINTDAILGSGYIEQFIEDDTFSIFATVGYSERPDVIASKILEGRVAILIDGTPVALTVPFIFIENFQSPDDYNYRFFYGSLLRWIRYFAFAISLLVPASFVALTTFHQELIPTSLLITMAAATEGTPFPAVIEVLVMGLFFEILREGGIRLPRPVGQAISIVGALVIGQATVTAGLIAAPTLIVVALTAVASFVVPTLVEETTPLRIFFVILAGFLGAFGIMIGLLMLLIHLTALRSFGVSYFAPISPIYPRELAQDVLLRAPWWAMFKRPQTITGKDTMRQDFRLMPHSPDQPEEDS